MYLIVLLGEVLPLAKKIKKSDKSTRTPNKKNIIDNISPDEALEVLRTLVHEDPNLVDKIEKIVNELLSSVVPDEIASEVYWELDNIDVEELWGRSGRTQYGYVEPQEMASQMMEEALEPFLEQLKRYRKLSFSKAAKNVCLGIMKGLYQFEMESTSDFKDWAVDEPAECAVSVLEEWKGEEQMKEDLLEIEEFIKQSLPNWHRFLVRVIVSKGKK